MTGAIGVFVVVLLWRFAILWAAAVFEAVGLSPTSARFEARSAMTGAGYTTTRSEAVALHPAARRAASALMLAGYVGPATVLTLLGVSFVLPPDGEGLRAQAITLGVLCGALVVLDRVGAIRAIGSRPARALARRTTGAGTFDSWTVIDDHAIATMVVRDGAGKALEAPGVRVLAVTSTGGDTISVTNGEPLRPGPGDRIVVFGRRDAIERLRTSAA